MIFQTSKIQGKIHAVGWGNGTCAYRRRIIYKWDDVNSRVIGTYFKTWYYRENGKWAGNTVIVNEYQTAILMQDQDKHRGMKRRVGQVQFFGRKAIQELTMALC